MHWRPNRLTLISLAAVATAAVFVLGFILLRPDSAEEPSVADQISSAQDAVHTLDGALALAMLHFTAGQASSTREVESVVYVETTVGEARALLDPGRTATTWTASDALDAWLIVAYGTFDFTGSVTPGRTAGSVSVVIPKGEPGAHATDGVARSDLSQLGTVVDVPLPLSTSPAPDLGE